MAKKRSVGIGVVGLGFMGLTHLRASRRLRGGRLVALATSDPRKARGDFSKVGGNFGDGGGAEDLSDLTIHPTLDALLADPKVDLVDICLPSYLHAGAAIQCLRAGKAVLVEKPVALKAADAKRMLDAARKAKQPLMVAHVLKFSAEFALLSEAVKSQRWGELRALHLRRLIAMPSWGDSGWFGDRKLSGGMVVDLHIHDTDFIVHLGGKPRSVTSSGVIDERGVSFIRTVYNHGKKSPLLSSEGGWINAPGLPFEQGFDAFFQDATLHYNSSTAPAPRLYTTAGRKMKELKMKSGDAFQQELQAAVDSLRSGKIDPRLSPKSAATSLAVCAAEEKSVRSRKTIEVKL
jgi:predicted dehydrogenase